MKKHNFVQLAEAQLAQGTLYCAGLDPHPFGGYENNMRVYDSISESDDRYIRAHFYTTLTMLSGIKGSINSNRYADVLVAVETYICEVVKILVEKCNIRVFKPQVAFYEQFGPAGNFLLMRVRNYIKELEKKNNIRVICLLDCKRGDIFTTQAAYFRGLLGNLKEDWGVDFSPYDFDIINVTPWMGSDVMVLLDKGKPASGLKLMRQGKGIIGVSKSSNPSASEYQELYVPERGLTLQMSHVQDCYVWSQEFDLEFDGLSTIGLVVGSTHMCDGSIRRTFPGTTLLVPGFGAQGGKFSLIMQELIRQGKWNGLGAIFSSSRGTLFPWIKKYGGSGKVENLETDLIAAVARHREQEEEAYYAQNVIDAGIVYPFK